MQYIIWNTVAEQRIYPHGRDGQSVFTYRDAIREPMAGRPCGESLLRALFDMAFVAGEAHGLETAQDIHDVIRRYAAA
jgi:hypothetical protein